MGIQSHSNTGLDTVIVRRDNPPGSSNNGYALLTPRYAAYSPYSGMHYAGGIDKGEFLYIDERFLAQIDWPVELRMLELVPVPLAPPAMNVRRQAARSHWLNRVCAMVSFLYSASLGEHQSDHLAQTRLRKVI